ncbi:MAG: hypothetical protein QM734_10050 [Cyclobacteriaceae bacterium]
MKKSLLLIFSLVSIACVGQKIEYTFSSPNDTSKNYYVTVFPKGEIKGSIILLPGFGELPQQTLVDWDLHKHASEAGYMTIIPALGDWSFFYMDESSHHKLNEFLNEVFKKYNLREDSFFIGGASLGGTMALQYAERAYAEKSKLRRPVAVFALDPPLDIERLYNCMTTTNRPKKHPVSIQEDNYITNRIQQEFKTNPKSNPQFFWKVSPYAESDTEHSSLKTLLKLPIRIYNEPDINWYIENRNIDFYCINSIDSSAMINWLRYLGNKEAELILTSGKGYRISSKMRHPHSWTIADGSELISWINKVKR